MRRRGWLGRTIVAAGVLLCLGCASSERVLAATGSIAGTVTGAPSHAPVAEVEVCTWEYKNGEIVETKEHCTFSTSNGHYEIDNLDEAEYLVVFWPRGQGQNYIPATYDPGGHWPGEPVTVGTSPVTGINVELPEGGSIKGRVTDEVGGEPLAGVTVCATRGYWGAEPHCALTDADGEYEVVGLVTDIYQIKFSPEQSGLQYFGEYYDDQRIGNGYPPESVSVTAGSPVSGIDAALEPSAEIRGVVTAAADGRPLNHILVCAAPTLTFTEYNTFDDEAKCKRTNDSGAYSLGLLEGGQYKVLFSLELREYIHYFPPLEPEEDGFPTRYWDEKDSLWDADVLTLAAPTVATGIDARLGPPAPAAITTPPASPVLPVRNSVHRRCKHGLKHKKIKGRYRCVKAHPKRHRSATRNRVGAIGVL